MMRFAVAALAALLWASSEVSSQDISAEDGASLLQLSGAGAAAGHSVKRQSAARAATKNGLNVRLRRRLRKDRSRGYRRVSDEHIPKALREHRLQVQHLVDEARLRAQKLRKDLAEYDATDHLYSGIPALMENTYAEMYRLNDLIAKEQANMNTKEADLVASIKKQAADIQEAERKAKSFEDTCRDVGSKLEEESAALEPIAKTPKFVHDALEKMLEESDLALYNTAMDMRLLRLQSKYELDYKGVQLSLVQTHVDTQKQTERDYSGIFSRIDQDMLRAGDILNTIEMSSKGWANIKNNSEVLLQMEARAVQQGLNAVQLLTFCIKEGVPGMLRQSHSKEAAMFRQTGDSIEELIAKFKNLLRAKDQTLMELRASVESPKLQHFLAFLNVDGRGAMIREPSDLQALIDHMNFDLSKLRDDASLIDQDLKAAELKREAAKDDQADLLLRRDTKIYRKLAKSQMYTIEKEWFQEKIREVEGKVSKLRDGTRQVVLAMKLGGTRRGLASESTAEEEVTENWQRAKDEEELKIVQDAETDEEADDPTKKRKQIAQRMFWGQQMGELRNRTATLAGLQERLAHVVGFESEDFLKAAAILRDGASELEYAQQTADSKQRQAGILSVKLDLVHKLREARQRSRVLPTLPSASRRGAESAEPELEDGLRGRVALELEEKVRANKMETERAQDEVKNIMTHYDEEKRIFEQRMANLTKEQGDMNPRLDSFESSLKKRYDDVTGLLKRADGVLNRMRRASRFLNEDAPEASPALARLRSEAVGKGAALVRQLSEARAMRGQERGFLELEDQDFKQTIADITARVPRLHETIEEMRAKDEAITKLRMSVASIARDSLKLPVMNALGPNGVPVNRLLVNLRYKYDELLHEHLHMSQQLKELERIRKEALAEERHVRDLLSDRDQQLQDATSGFGMVDGDLMTLYKKFSQVFGEYMLLKAAKSPH